MTSILIHPIFALPRGAVRNLHAYYALIVIEFRRGLLSLVVDSAEGRAVRQMLLRDYAIEDYVPCVLNWLQTGFADERRTLMPNDPLMQLLPESNVLNMLGMREKRITAFASHVKQYMKMAKEDGVSLAPLAVTSLPGHTVMFADTESPTLGASAPQSVVALFLAARVTRLAARPV